MNKQQLKIVVSTLTIIISAILLIASMNYYQDYLITTLCITAAMVGFAPPFFIGEKFPMPKQAYFKYSFITLIMALIVPLLFVSNPLMLLNLVKVSFFAFPIVWFFSYLAFRINDRRIIKVKDFFR